MSARDTIRDAAITALLAANTMAAQAVFSPRTYPTWSGEYPVIIVRTPRTQRSSIGAVGPPTFNTDITLTVLGRLEGTDEESAYDAAQALADEIETALLRNGYWLFTCEIQEITQVDSAIEASAQGKLWIGECRTAITCRVPEVMEPTIDAAGDPFPPPTDLATVVIQADLIAPFDRTGSYPAPTNPSYTPPAAPRTQGPDGRVEAGANVTLT